jgi:hypothetical protein
MTMLAQLQARSRTAGLPVLAFLFVVACTAGPLAAHLYLPLVDLPNHIARLHIAATGGAGPLAQYYSYTAALVPNEAIDMLWRGLGFPLDAVRFANLMMVVYAVNFVVATMVLARVVHGRWTLWSAASGLLVFNSSFFWGFQNFVWSLPFSLYALALWLRLEPRGTALRVAVFVPIALAIYLMHFFVFAFLAVLVAGREVQTWVEPRQDLWRGLFRRVLLMVPFVLPVLWLALSLLDAPPAPSGNFTSYGSWDALFWRLFFLLIAPNAAGFSALNLLGMLGLGLIWAVTAKLWSKSGPRLVLAQQMRGAVIALALAAICAPHWLNGVAMVDIRAPALLGAVLIAGSRWEGLGRRQAIALTTVFAALILARGIAFDRFAARYEADVADMFSATEALPAGARLLPLRGPGMEGDVRFFHLQGLLVARREVFVPTLFQGVHALELRPEWAAYAHPALYAIAIRRLLGPETFPDSPVFAQDWEHKFTYALLMDKMPPPQDPRLQVVATQGRFTLFAIKPDAGRN